LSTTTYCPQHFELLTIRVTSESGGVNGNTRKWVDYRMNDKERQKKRPFEGRKR